MEGEHATIKRWGIRDSPPLAEAFPRRQRPGWGSWRLEETDSKGPGEGQARSRAGAQDGQPRDVPRTEPRDPEAARRFLTQASRRPGRPEIMTRDGRDAQAAAIKSSNEAHGTALLRRQVTYANPIVAQAHRAVKRSPRPLLGVKACEAAQATLSGLARMHRSKQRQRVGEEGGRGPDCGRTVLLPGCLIPSPDRRTGPFTTS